MDNPFLRRASEYLRDDEAFLAVVSPEPLSTFLRKPGQTGVLYDRLVLLQGTPGSGKTTLARLFEFPTLNTLLRNSTASGYQALAGAMADCGAIADGRPTVIGCRLPMETDYRDFWEFPYSEQLRAGLLTTFIQARAVLAWFRHLGTVGVEATRVRIIPRAGAETALDAIGGLDGASVLARAKQVESAVYDVVGALVAPPELALSSSVTGAYRPFDVIERIELDATAVPTEPALRLHPLVILDDAHALHPTQFRVVQRWLARRELRIARWIITRFDILLPHEALAAVTENRENQSDFPGLTASRDVESVLLQNCGPRREQRTAFRRLARDMAGRYLQKHSLLGPRRLDDLRDLLMEQEEILAPSIVKKITEEVDSTQRRLRVSASRRTSFETEVKDFRADGQPVLQDVQLAMLSILFNRYARRRKAQEALFEDDPEPSKPVVANPGVHENARLHLLHRFKKPFYFGIDDLSDASSENAELFLQLSAVLVDTVATQVIRSRSPQLSAETQDRLLRARSEWIIGKWSFPYHQEVRRLVGSIARKCVDVTMEPNGWLTPNSYGILQDEFESIATTHAELARVLQFAVAYNALLIVPHYNQGGKNWCLLELGGMVIMAHGLSLKRGGFLEGNADELAGMTGGQV